VSDWGVVSAGERAADGGVDRDEDAVCTGRMVSSVSVDWRCSPEERGAEVRTTAHCC